jgi:tripartite-type tricarboxylate transporter receptor subunit TctC
MLNRRRFSLASLLLSLDPARVLAQTTKPWLPQKPIRLIVPYSAGGTTDLIARLIQEPLQQKFKQPVVVESMPGASGMIGFRAVINAKPDGHTLFFGNNGPVLLAPLLQGQQDPLSQLTPLGLVCSGSLLLMTHPSIPASSLQELIAYLRQNPGRVEYASAGNDSLGHYATMLFEKMSQTRMVHIPYQGQAPSTTALVSGEVKLLLTSPSSSMLQFIKQGKIRLLAVSSKKPDELFKNTPTINSQVADYAVDSWFGIFGPAGMPDEIVNSVNAALTQTLASEKLKSQLLALQFLPAVSTLPDFRSALQAEMLQWTHSLAVQHHTTTDGAS